MSYIADITSNILANALFWLALGACVWSWSSRTRRRFLQFFGLKNEATAPTVYLSNLWTSQSDIAPRPAARSIGYTISLHEFRAVQSINKLFGSAPLRLPELTRGLIDAFWIRTVAQPTVLVAPPSTRAQITTDAIVVGSAARNSIRRSINDMQLPCLAFDTEAGREDLSSNGGSRYLVVRRGPRTGEHISTDLNLAILERIVVADGGHTVFLCAGTRADTSFAATEYLVRNWSRLEREFRGGEFALALGFAGGDAYMETYSEPRELFRTPT